MNNTHLTDEILQAYLLKENIDDNTMKHLSACSLCQEKLTEYQFLIDTMQEVTTEPISFNTTTLVMSQIMLYEQKKSRKEEWIFWGVLILLIIIIISVALPFIPNVLYIFHATSFTTTLLLAGTGLCVFAFLLVDTIRRFHMKEVKLFKSNLQPIL